MADSADAEELDVFRKPHFQRPVSSRTRQLNIADNGKVVNAATDGIQIREQKVDIAGAAKEVNVDDRSTRVANTQNSANNSVNVFHFSGGPPYDSMSRPFPKDDSGAFIYNLKRTDLIPPTSNYQPTWDETHENFSDPRELARQRVNTFTLWHDTKITDSLHGVETAVFNFCQRRGLKNRSSKKPSWTRTKENIRQASSRARNHYKQDYLLQDQMVDLLRNINDFLTSDDELQFLGWLDWLPEDSHRRCLADSVGYILMAVVDCYPFDRSTIGYLENVLSLFSKSTEYVQLCRERRPTADMPATTVYIFTQTAELLTSLLDYDLLKTQEKGKHSKQIQTTIDRLRRTLDDINHSARVKLRGGGRVRKPSEDDDNAELQLYTTVHNLCREVPAMYEARATAYLTRRMSQIASDSPQRGLSTDASSDARQSTTEDIISKEQALDALSFRGSDNKKDIDDCLKYAEISGHEKAQLAVLTREDAFQDWLKEDRRSSALVIHGNLDDDENTPISYLAAQIGEKYRKKRGYIVLSWFCGLNTDENGAAIMARLTGQLLSQATRLLPPEDFNFISRHEYKKLKQRDLKMLISAFSNTIQKLRSKRIVVFCLIDSISTYETGNLRKDTEKLVLFFRSLVRSTRRRSREDMKHELIFKLLISDGQSSELAIKYFKDREIMEIDDEADTDVDSDASLVNSD